MQESDSSQFFSDEEPLNDTAIGEQCSNGCLLSFDILSEVDFVIGEDSSSLDANILLRAGIKYKRYERMLSAEPVVAILIETQRFTFTITRHQISAKLYYLNASEEYIALYKCLITALIPSDFKTDLKVFSQSAPSCEYTISAGQIILQHLQEERAQARIEYCKTSPTKMICSESVKPSHEVFLPKITASIAMTIESFKDSHSPRSSMDSPRELVPPLFNGSPRSQSSPRVTDSLLALTPSPRDENSPRETSSPRNNGGTRLLCFFKRMGSEHFAIKKSPGRSPRNLLASDEGSSPRRRVSNADKSTHSETDATLSPVKSSSVPESLSYKNTKAAIKIQKTNSVVTTGSGNVPTEILYSPRGRSLSEASSSPRNRRQSQELLDHDSVTDILLYCGTEVIAWCDSLSLRYRKIKHEFFITLPNNDIIRIHGHRIDANSLNTNTVNMLIDLIKILPQVENVSIYYVSQGTVIDENIVSRLSSSPPEPEASTLSIH